VRRRCAFVVAIAACMGCDSESQAPAPSPAPAALAPATSASASPAPSASVEAIERMTSCQAPSLDYDRSIDGRTSEALSTCVAVRTPNGRSSHRCGLSGEPPAIDVSRLRDSLLQLDPATTRHALEIFGRGRGMGRNARAVGLVGDSMTLSNHFLRPFSDDDRMQFELAPPVAELLRTEVDGDPRATIIDFYRGASIHRKHGRWRDSFGATRAAEVGVRANWPLRGGHESPLARLLRDINPALALVAYGGNDAAYRPASPEVLADTFELHFDRLLDELERAGVVPILSTVPRHGHQPGVPDCGGVATNWHVAVATSAISARIAEIACRRHLPLIDLRHAVDAAENYGLGPDGVHPSWHRRGGAGTLTAAGLQCGYNVRNLLSLMALRQLKELLFDREDDSSRKEADASSRKDTE